MTDELARPETLRDVADTNPAPQPVSENPRDSVERLCEYDPGGQSGCRRTSTILALEAEFDTFVSPEMFWGFWDQFCQHEGYIYYYKGWLEENINRDINSIEDSRTQTEIAKITSYLGYTLGYQNLTFNTIKELFTSEVPGLPKLVIETPQFIQCEDVGTDKITVDNIDKATLDKIKQTFTGDVHPLMANIADSLHIKDGKVFCTDVLAYEHNPNGKLGVLMIPSVTEKYQVGKPYFFPFDTLTAEQVQVVNALANTESEFAGEVTIITL